MVFPQGFQIFTLIAWTVCILLLSLPSLLGVVVTFSLLGHLSQIVFKKTSMRVDRT
jgi:hypothetical protein